MKVPDDIWYISGLMTQYCFKWYYGVEPRYGWFIRGILPDRRFYGEVTMYDGNGGKQLNATGVLSEQDYLRFISLVEEIKVNTQMDESDAPWEGLLAEGPVNNPRVIFTYRDRDTHATAAGSYFLKIVDLLAPYLRQFRADGA